MTYCRNLLLVLQIRDFFKAKNVQEEGDRRTDRPEDRSQALNELPYRFPVFASLSFAGDVFCLNAVKKLLGGGSFEVR